VTAYPALSGRFLVTALPTIYHVKDGVFRKYEGTREAKTFLTFIEEKKWQSIEPITNWKAPNSVQMTVVSYLFKLSMVLRHVHNSLVEDYGIPYWGSYVLFGFLTIVFGAFLGLLLVCFIDLIWPVKPQQPAPPKKDKEDKKKEAKAKTPPTSDEDDSEGDVEDEEEEGDQDDDDEDIIDDEEDSEKIEEEEQQEEEEEEEKGRNLRRRNRPRKD